MTIRCAWVPDSDELYIKYHDEEWGVPVYDDRELFRMLILEGAHAGLSWRTILGKREGYDRVFHDFDVHKVAAMTDDDLETALHNPDIVRNRLKVYSTRKNAQVFIALQKECGSFSDYLWSWVDHQPVVGHWKSVKDVPAKTELSDTISKDLKKRKASPDGLPLYHMTPVSDNSACSSPSGEGDCGLALAMCSSLGWRSSLWWRCGTSS